MIAFLSDILVKTECFSPIMPCHIHLALIQTSISTSFGRCTFWYSISPQTHKPTKAQLKTDYHDVLAYAGSHQCGLVCNTDTLDSLCAWPADSHTTYELVDSFPTRPWICPIFPGVPELLGIQQLDENLYRWEDDVLIDLLSSNSEPQVGLKDF